MSLEQFRPVIGFEGFYEVSNLGRVQSLSRLTKGKHPGYLNRKKGKLLKPTRTKGYEYLNLCKLGIRSYHLVHRMVAEAWIKRPIDSSKEITLNPHARIQAAHLNGVTFDNRAENLCWATPKENTAHQILHGTRRFGVDVHNHILKETEVQAMRLMRQTGATFLQIAAAFNRNRVTTRYAIRGITWAHVK